MHSTYHIENTDSWNWEGQDWWANRRPFG